MRVTVLVSLVLASLLAVAIGYPLRGSNLDRTLQYGKSPFSETN
jgi:hypothetical protein